MLQQQDPPGKLVYTDDGVPGYRREADGRGGFQYRDRKGHVIRHPAVLARIRALGIPPAYTDVWICPRADGHLQATGRDKRGRKQYRYHAAWSALRDAHKFDQLFQFGTALTRIRRCVRKDLDQSGLPRTRILALVIALLDHTLIRIGGTEYAQKNHSYGLTTLQRHHTRVAGSQIRFQFRGKSGVTHDVTLRDKRLATLLRHCLDIPGQRLFKYRDEHGTLHAIDSTAVNQYLRGISHGDFTAKHFRTWGASVMAFDRLRQSADRPTATARQSRELEVVRCVARRLGNTAAICRRCYVHPAILDAYRHGELAGSGRAPRSPKGLSASERRLLDFLRTDAAAQTPGTPEAPVQPTPVERE